MRGRIPFLSLTVALLFAAQAIYVASLLPPPAALTGAAKDGGSARLPPFDIQLIAASSGLSKEIVSDIAEGYNDAVRAAGIGGAARLVVRDGGGATLAAQAGDAARNSQTLAIIGATPPDGIADLAAAADQSRIVALAPLGAPSKSAAGSWTFPLQASAFTQGEMLGRTLLQFLPGGKIVEFIPANQPADGFWHGLTTVWDGRPGASLRRIVWDPAGDPARQIAAITDIMALDCLIVSLPGDAAEALIRELRTIGYPGQIVATGDASLASFPERFKGERKEAIARGYYTYGVLSIVPFTPRIASPESKRVVQAYRATHQSEPSWAYALGYDSGLLVAGFVADAKAGAGVSPRDMEKTRAAFRQYLLGLAMSDDEVRGLSGPLRFDSANQRDLPQKIVVTLSGRQIPFQMQFSDQPRVVEPGEASENTVRLNDAAYTLIPAVRVGMQLLAVSQVDFHRGTFDADFDIWFKSKDPVDIADFEFPNQVGPLKSSRLQSEVPAAYYTYRRYAVSGTFSFQPAAADVLLLRSQVGISLRHRKLDISRLKLVLDANADVVGATPARFAVSDGFTIQSDLLSVDDHEVAGQGDPRAIDNVVTYSIASYEALVTRSDRPLISSMVHVLGSPAVEFVFLGLTAAFGLLVLVRTRVRTAAVEMAFPVLFLAEALFSECALFVTPLAERIGDVWVPRIPYLYNAAFTLIVLRQIDLVISRAIQGAVARVHIPPVVLPIARIGVYCLGLALYYTFILEGDIWPVLATSSVLLTVVGLALSNVIADTVAGLAIVSHRELRKGQWVCIRIGEHTVTGQIDSWGWRKTRIRSRDGHLHYVSNSDLTNLTLENLSMGTGYIAVTIGFEMSAEVEAMDVLPAIQTSAAAALASDPSVDPDHPIGVHIEGLEGSTLKCVVLLRYLAEKDTYRLRTATLEAVRETLVRMDALDSSEVAVVRRAAHPA